MHKYSNIKVITKNNQSNIINDKSMTINSDITYMFVSTKEKKL